MKRSFMFLSGLGAAVALGFLIPMANSQSAPPSSPSGYVEATEGECVKTWIIEHWADDPGGFTTPEQAIELSFPGESAAMSKREVKADEHVVFEKYENGKLVAVHDVVSINGEWVLDTTQSKVPCK